MATPANQIRTLEDAGTAVGIMKARMQLLATAMADALAEAQANQPGACERITRILGPARERHLQFLRAERQ
jgi:hypothetical protein